MKRLDWLPQLLAPVLLVVLVGAVAAATTSAGDEIKFRNAIVNVAIVVALYVFVGNSGVISFGQVSFVAVGAFAAGLMTVPADVKPGVLPDLFSFLKHHSVSSAWSLVLAAAVGGLYALLVGAPLMRLSGLAAGIATFAVLGVTYNILTYWTKIGPGATTLSLIPDTTDFLLATCGAVAVVVIAFAYQRSRFGRQLRAAREDPAAAQAAGISVHRQRLWAFVLSGALSGFAGGLLVHLLGSITTVIRSLFTSQITRFSGSTGSGTDFGSTTDPTPGGKVTFPPGSWPWVSRTKKRENSATAMPCHFQPGRSFIILP